MSEWSNVPAWKASIVKAIGGSNPLLSAKEKKARAIFICSCFFLAAKRGKGFLGTIVPQNAVKFLSFQRNLNFTRSVIYGHLFFPLDDGISLIVIPEVAAFFGFGFAVIINCATT